MPNLGEPWTRSHIKQQLSNNISLRERDKAYAQTRSQSGRVIMELQAPKRRLIGTVWIYCRQQVLQMKKRLPEYVISASSWKTDGFRTGQRYVWRRLPGHLLFSPLFFGTRSGEFVYVCKLSQSYFSDNYHFCEGIVWFSHSILLLTTI